MIEFITLNELSYFWSYINRVFISFLNSPHFWPTSFTVCLGEFALCFFFGLGAFVILNLLGIGGGGMWLFEKFRRSQTPPSTRPEPQVSISTNTRSGESNSGYVYGRRERDGIALMSPSQSQIRRSVQGTPVFSSQIMEGQIYSNDESFMRRRFNEQDEDNSTIPDRLGLGSSGAHHHLPLSPQ